VQLETSRETVLQSFLKLKQAVQSSEK